jgi:esterase/lipase
MFSKISSETLEAMESYPITDSSLPFAGYIQQCQAIIAGRREDLSTAGANREKILHANTPFEYRPRPARQPHKTGALLMHGLLDCPFTFRELCSHLQDQGILCRSILLPGHGTRPSDLLSVTYHEWLQAVRYGIETLKHEVDSIFLIGYSTGAALAIYHALENSRITGLILMAPAIKIRTPVDVAVNWYHLANYLGKDRDWVYHCEEDDYAKYKSITYNAVKQVCKLSESIRDLCRDQQVKQPIYMILSREDETISSHEAIDFFSAMHHSQSKMLLYTAAARSYPDARIETRSSVNNELNVVNLSHTALLYSADNSHYGQQGDYKYASHLHEGNIYGAYNRIETNAFDLMKKYGLAQHPRRLITYNPDFHYLANSISAFITDNLHASVTVP